MFKVPVAGSTSQSFDQLKRLICDYVYILLLSNLIHHGSTLCLPYHPSTLLPSPAKKKCFPVSNTSILSPTFTSPSPNGVTCIPRHALLLPSSITLYLRSVVMGSLRSAMPVSGSTFGNLQRVVRQEMWYVVTSELEGEAIFAFVQLSSSKAGGPVI